MTVPCESSATHENQHCAPDGQRIRRTPVLDFIDRKCLFIRPLPCQPSHSVNVAPARWRKVRFAVGIIELDIELVGLESAIVRHGQAD